MKIPFSKIDCSGRELDYIAQVLESGWITTAGKAAELERRFAAAVGARYACAVNSCTAALHLGLEALGVREGDSVLVQSMTFTASAEIIRYLGADPVFLDCDPHTRLLTPAIVAAAIERCPRASALVVVHFGGQAAQMLDSGDGPGILSICRRHGIRVVEDAAHAFPTRHQGRMVGSFGDVTCFSFYANKTITTGEGGMLVTRDEHVYNRATLMRLHGIDRAVWDRYCDAGAGWQYDVVAPGFKYNMPDINAAVGLAQLERFEDLREAREACCRYYHEHLAGIEWLERPEIQCSWADHSCHLYPVIVRDGAPVTRDALIDLMSACGIGTGVHYKPLHRMSYYRERYGLKPGDFPNTEYIWKGTVSLPVYPGLGERELAHICNTIRKMGEKWHEPGKGA